MRIFKNGHALCGFCEWDFGENDPQRAVPEIRFCPECGMSLKGFVPPVDTGLHDQNANPIFNGSKIHIVQKRVSERGEFEDFIEDWTGEVRWDKGAFYLYRSPYNRELLSKYAEKRWTLETMEVVDERK